MASSSFSISDLTAAADLLHQLRIKCKDAPDGFQCLAGELHAAQLLLDSIGNAVENNDSDLPHIHQKSLARVIAGFTETLSGLSRRLELNPQPSELDLNIVESPQDARLKLNLNMSMLNVWLSAVIYSSMTKAQRLTPKTPQSVLIPSTNIPNQSQAISVLAQPKTQPRTSTAPLRPTNPAALKTQDLISQWSPPTSSSMPISAHGIFTYNSALGSSPFQKPTPVTYTLSITNSSHLQGESEDSVGTAKLTGSIDPHHGTLRFLKTYVSPPILAAQIPVWEYEGFFTPRGIVGEWHYPGDPPDKAYCRGRFCIWQGGEGEEAREEMEERLSALVGRNRAVEGQMGGQVARK